VPKEVMMEQGFEFMLVTKHLMLIPLVEMEIESLMVLIATFSV
jgi:hypothetical protein